MNTWLSITNISYILCLLAYNRIVESILLKFLLSSDPFLIECYSFNFINKVAISKLTVLHLPSCLPCDRVSDRALLCAFIEENPALSHGVQYRRYLNRWELLFSFNRSYTKAVYGPNNHARRELLSASRKFETQIANNHLKSAYTYRQRQHQTGYPTTWRKFCFWNKSSLLYYIRESFVVRFLSWWNKDMTMTLVLSETALNTYPLRVDLFTSGLSAG